MCVFLPYQRFQPVKETFGGKKVPLVRVLMLLLLPHFGT
jgi:hypothetical protein